MKIGILTFPHSPSYGASLQMHALYTKILQLGKTPYIINYQNNHMRQMKHINKYNVLKKILIKFMSIKTKKMFYKFERQLKFYPKKTIHDKKSLYNLSLYFDYFVVGSDQVWNPFITGNDKSYFLDFCDNNKKISYAASFGVDNLEDNSIFELISRIKYVSVREIEGAEMIRQKVTKDVELVLDPTFLLTKEYWNSLMPKKRVVKKKYILSFIFNLNDENANYVKNLSNLTNLPVVCISDNWFKKKKKNNINVSGVGPVEFLRLIHDAEYIITDSFHGTAFSILLNKQFYVSLSTKTNSRLITLLNQFNLFDRIISGDSINNGEIDYLDVNSRIRDLREKSIHFLQRAFKNEM